MFQRYLGEETIHIVTTTLRKTSLVVLIGKTLEGKKRKEDAWALLNGIDFAKLDADYNDAFEKLARFNDDLAKWVTENNPEHCAMSKFPKKRWDKMTTNIVESFKSWLRKEHHQTIYTLLLMHIDKLVGMLTNHISHTEK